MSQLQQVGSDQRRLATDFFPDKAKGLQPGVVIVDLKRTAERSPNVLVVPGPF